MTSDPEVWIREVAGPEPDRFKDRNIIEIARLKRKVAKSAPHRRYKEHKSLLRIGRIFRENWRTKLRIGPRYWDYDDRYLEREARMFSWRRTL